MAVEKIYIIYFMHIDLIQFSLFDRWMKLNFDSEWALSSKTLFYTFKNSFSYV